MTNAPRTGPLRPPSATPAGRVFHRRNSGFASRVDSARTRRTISAQATRTHMHIDLNEAIRIHARIGRARYGRGAKKRPLNTPQTRRGPGDSTGAGVWEPWGGKTARTDAKPKGSQ